MLPVLAMSAPKTPAELRAVAGRFSPNTGKDVGSRWWWLDFLGGWGDVADQIGDSGTPPVDVEVDVDGSRGCTPTCTCGSEDERLCCEGSEGGSIAVIVLSFVIVSYRDAARESSQSKDERAGVENPETVDGA